jgi:hypothetical protein
MRVAPGRSGGRGALNRSTGAGARMAMLARGTARRTNATAQLRRARAGGVGHEGANEWHGMLPNLHAKLRVVSSSTDRRRRGGSMTVAG